MGKGGFEPPRLAAHDPKSCLSASSSTSPRAFKPVLLPLGGEIIPQGTQFFGNFLWYNAALGNSDWSIALSRLIKTETVGKDRTRLTKSIVLAVRELAKQKDVNPEAKDLAAFIVMALKTISDGIDESVAAWEKRGYWVKADRFRMEWLWTGQFAEKMKNALLQDDWGTIAMLMPQIAMKLNKIQIAENHRLGKPWVGVYKKMMEEEL